MRGSGRVPFSLELAAIVAGFPKPIPATLLDLSITGCRITARSVLLVNSTIEFRLPLSSSLTPVARGKICRCTPTEPTGTLEYGIEFTPFAPDDARAIQAFIEDEYGRHSREYRTARVETEFPMECVIAGQREVIPAIAIDIGRGGMRVACERALPEGSALTLRFTLPEAPQNGRELVLRGRIVQRKQQFREYHHNVAFLDADANSVERIDRFVRSQR